MQCLQLARLPKFVSPLSVTSKLTNTVPSSTVPARTLLTAPKEKKVLKKVLCANRGEIAIRVFRAARELGISTVAIYSEEDRLQAHRRRAQQSFLVGKGLNPVRAYLNYPEIIQIALENGVDGIHPGYGFLSENGDFAEAVERAGIKWIGPTPQVIRKFGDKTAAREIATTLGVPIIPGTGEINTADDVIRFGEKHGFPIILKASFGGGGRGMRIVRTPEEAKEAFQRCRSEAEASFGNGAIFVEKYLENPAHIEVQILADAHGNIVHLYERDCSIQRRHQKVVEIAPAPNLDPNIRDAMTSDALILCRKVGYRSAGTVEFLVDKKTGSYFFIEINPRIQVEHTVTESITGIDIVQSQLMIAGGYSLHDLGINQNGIHCMGSAIQCRVTTEDPRKNFQPDNGRIENFRAGEGMGIRLDGASGFAGAMVSPHYDPLLVKVTGHALDFKKAAVKVSRSLNEFRIGGVTTNLQFLQNILALPDFQEGNLHTGFIEEHAKDLLVYTPRQRRVRRLLDYIGQTIVNGTQAIGADLHQPVTHEPYVPHIDKISYTDHPGWRHVFLEEGPRGFAKAVRQHKGLLITDTTWRDAHQSLLATRIRTRDLKTIAPHTRQALKNAYSLEMWGGATFDVALRFLHECPWRRLEELRQLVPDIPFQMLLRGANAVGYTNYPDNVIDKFCKLAVEYGMDVFRVFDSLNSLDGLKVGIDAVGAAGGVIEAAVCYTGDILNPSKDNKYNIDYYMNIIDRIVKHGTHVLAIKDMAGLLKPDAATYLVSTIRQQYPDIPIHVHTHDTAGTGVASMVAAARAGADVVDCAIDALSGTTSQPSMGAVVASLQGTSLDTGLNLSDLTEVNNYWEEARGMYGPFESGQKTGSIDVYEHEMPGGQYTNLLFQSKQLGLAGQWSEVKKAYALANKILGDIVKVTPSSKVVGDFAQFLVANRMTDREEIEAKAGSLDLPSSVIEFLQGKIGVPEIYGLPEPFTTNVLTAKGLAPYKGEHLPPFDFEKLKKDLKSKYETYKFREVDFVSAALYPKVFKEYLDFIASYGEISELPTQYFILPMTPGEELAWEMEKGGIQYIKFITISSGHDSNGCRTVYFEVNGQPLSIQVVDKRTLKGDIQAREQADPNNPGSVGAPMNGVVVEIRHEQGRPVHAGGPLLVLSAMKMETVVSAPVGGKIKKLAVRVGDHVKTGDLLCEIEVPK